MSTPMTYTTDDVARMLGKSRDWVRDAANTRKFPHLRIGKSIRFSEAHLQQIIALLEQAPAEHATPIGQLTSRSRARRPRTRRPPRQRASEDGAA